MSKTCNANTFNSLEALAVLLPTGTVIDGETAEPTDAPRPGSDCSSARRCQVVPRKWQVRERPPGAGGCLEHSGFEARPLRGRAGLTRTLAVASQRQWTGRLPDLYAGRPESAGSRRWAGWRCCHCRAGRERRPRGQSWSCRWGACRCISRGRGCGARTAVDRD